MQEQKSIRQMEIIEAAGKILATSGVSGLTIKNLAKEMNFAESAIYRHFASKEVIIVSLLHFLAEDMDKRYADIRLDLKPEERFKAMFQNQFSFFDAHPYFASAMFSDGLLEASPQINEKILQIMAVRKKHLKPIISDGQKKGVFAQTVSTEDLLHIVMGSVRLLMYKWRIDEFKFDIVKEGNQLIESLLILIKK